MAERLFCDSVWYVACTKELVLFSQSFWPVIKKKSQFSVLKTEYQRLVDKGWMAKRRESWGLNLVQIEAIFSFSYTAFPLKILSCVG